MGEVKSIEVQPFELGRRLVSLNPGERPQIRSPHDIARLVKAEMSALGQEHLRVLLLNTRNHRRLARRLSRQPEHGRRQGRRALRGRSARTAALVLVHNHERRSDPSPEDVELTKQVVEAGTLLDVSVLDHLVIGHGEARGS